MNIFKYYIPIVTVIGALYITYVHKTFDYVCNQHIVESINRCYETRAQDGYAPGSCRVTTNLGVIYVKEPVDIGQKIKRCKFIIE